MIVSGLFKTTDGALSWREIGSVAGVKCLVIDPTNSSILYAGTDQGIAKSTNGGESWTDASANLPTGSVTRLVIDPSTPSTLYALSSTPSAMFSQIGPLISIFKSANGGGSWQALDTGLPPNAYITLLAIAPASPSTLYIFAPAAFAPPGSGPSPVGGLLKSVDGGQSWKTLDIGPGTFTFVSSLAIDPAAAATVYASTNRGVLKSADAGETWNPLQSDLPQNISIGVLITDRADPTAVYAAGSTFGPAGPAQRYSGARMEATIGARSTLAFRQIR